MIVLDLRGAGRSATKGTLSFLCIGDASYP